MSKTGFKPVYINKRINCLAKLDKDQKGLIKNDFPYIVFLIKTTEFLRPIVYAYLKIKGKITYLLNKKGK